MEEFKIQHLSFKTILNGHLMVSLSFGILSNSDTPVLHGVLPW